MSRIENGKFEIYKDMFNLKETVKEVSDCLEFQASSKNIKLESHIER